MRHLVFWRTIMNEIKIWVNKGKESEKDRFYYNATTINLGIKYKSNISSNITEQWYKLGVKRLPSLYEDLYIISLVVFAVDKRVPRSVFSDAWTRNISVNIPVINLTIWNNVQNDLNQMLSYLSGDKWSIDFRNCEEETFFESWRKRQAKRPEYLDRVNSVSLFSGGLDSLCGAYKLLSEGSTLFVGFQEYGKLKEVQYDLLNDLKKIYTDTYCDLISFTAVARGLDPYQEIELFSEKTSRSRSFLFLSAAITIAGIVGDGTPVYIPENGFIGLNLPMTASRLGSCSTRTTHPYYLKMFNSLLQNVGINHQIINPYAFSTKREMVNELTNVPGFISTISKTISCSHPCNGRWDGYPVPQNCGYCYPCIIRQSSLLDINQIQENYGNNILRANYINFATDAKKSDLVDLLSSIVSAQNSSDHTLRRKISSTGKISSEEVEKFLRLYKSTIQDLIELLSESKDYKRLFGEQNELY